MRRSRGVKKFLIFLLIISLGLLLWAPDNYSQVFCIYCFIVFVTAAWALLDNNIRAYKSLFLFEVLFTLSFLFANYVYPVFIYVYDPYFSLFRFSFNEYIISKCTALATVGYVSYCIGQIKETSVPQQATSRGNYVLSPINTFDIFILFTLFLLFLIPNLTALRSGYSESGGGGFFYLFALIFIYKYFAHSRGITSRSTSLVFFLLIGSYIIVSFLLGNRGEPMYLCVAILYCYHTYVKKISNIRFLTLAAVGLIVFYFIGIVRISSNQVGVSSRSERISSWEAEDSFLRYGNELIINNRSLFVLVDYADNTGFSYGKTWSVNFFSMVPFGQSFALNVLGIPKQEFSTTHLTTYLEFGEDDPNAFGLGTNLIGDIYVSFGTIGVLLLMYLFGLVVRRVHDNSIKAYSYYQVFYIILLALSVYYTRATLFSPMQMLSWTFVISLLSRKKVVNN